MEEEQPAGSDFPRERYPSGPAGGREASLRPGVENTGPRRLSKQSLFRLCSVSPVISTRAEVSLSCRFLTNLLFVLKV